MPEPPPPTRPPGTIDLLETAENHPSDPSWRADPLGRSRHSRIADEVREPLHDTDPGRAERLCAEVTRNALRDFAPGLLLLSASRRRRAQALTSWLVTLFDFATRPGLAGLDGDRLAQINAWEYRTEEALDGNPPGQPIFVAMAQEEAKNSWPRPAMDRIVAAARSVALRSPEDGGRVRIDSDTAAAILEALFSEAGSTASGEAAHALAPLLQATLASTAENVGEPALSVKVSRAPLGWRRAASYAKRRLSLRDETLGLRTRLRLLLAAALRPA